MRAAGRLVPPIALMGLIYFLSDQPDLSTGLGVWDTILRKLAHMAVYGALWFLWWRGLGYGNPLTPAAIALVYAASDEYHQSHVEGRHGTPVDVAIDAIGVSLAAAVTLRARRRSSRPSRPDGGQCTSTATDRA